MGKQLYFAYGSNLNIEQMSMRCPGAVKKEVIVIDNFALVFRRVADIEYREGSILYGGLWEITPECERALDRYEGVSSGLYLKRFFRYKKKDVLFYTMASLDISPPMEYYADIIRQGYDDFHLPRQALESAIEESFGDKIPKKIRRVK